MTASGRWKRGLFVLGLLAFSGRGAGAADYAVDSVDDFGPGTFGSALDAVGAGDGSQSDGILFGPLFDIPRTITFSRSPSAVVKAAGSSLNVSAPSLLTVEDGGSTVLNVSGGGVFAVHNVAFNGSGVAGLAVGPATTLSLDQGFGTGLLLDGGILQPAADLTAAGQIVLSGASVIDVGAGRTATLTGALIGSGGLTKTGAGTLVLGGGSNFYLGGTTVAGGVLSVSADGQLGFGGGVALAGAALRTASGFSSTRDLALSGGGTLEVSAGRSEWSGTISGTGGLIKTGAGALVLSGANGYGGGTAVLGGTLSIGRDENLGDAAGGVVLDGGTLLFSRDVALGRAFDLGAAGGGIDTGGHDVLLSGLLAGAGALRASGGGTLTLTGANTYRGGTLVLRGTLAVSGDGALGESSGALYLTSATLRTEGAFLSSRNVFLNGGAVVDTDGNDAAFSGSFSGAGGLTKSGAGVLYLSGSNSYAGGTTVSGGTLTVRSDAGLGDAAGRLTLSAATLRAAGDVASRRNVSLGGGAVVDTDGHEVSLGGVLGGSGGLTKTGAGTLALGGANTYAGRTWVQGGALRLLPGGALPGGALSTAGGALFDMNGVDQTLGAVTNAGSVRTGAGTLSAASYGGGGTLDVLLRPDAPSLDVSGTADLSGGTLSVGGYPAAGRYTVISAGALQGTFAAIQVPAGKTAAALYAGDRLLLDISTLSRLRRAGMDDPQARLAALLDAAAPASAGDLDEVIVRLNGLSPAAQARALGQIAPVGYAALGDVSFAASRAQSAAVRRRAAALRGEGGDDERFAGFFGGPAMDFPAEDLPGVHRRAAAERESSPWGFFVAASGSAGRRESQGAQPGYDFGASGATAGVDCWIGEGLSAGASLGYLGGSAEVFQGGGSVDEKSLRYGVYGAGGSGPFHATLYVGGASDAYRSKRAVAALGRTAEASPRGWELNADAEAGYEVKTRPADVSFLAGADYDRLSLAPFSETGAGALDLDVAAQTASSLRSTLGIKLSRGVKEGGVTWTPELRAGWLHEFARQGRAIDATLSSVGAFRTETADLPRNGVSAGAGLTVGGEVLSVGFGYAGEFRPGFRNQGISGHLRAAF